MRVALLQLSVGDDPAENLPKTLALVDEAVQKGAEFILTPEVTNCISSSRSHQDEVLQFPQQDRTLLALQKAAKTHHVWILIGSIAVKTTDPDGRFANRSFLIAPDGTLRADYDKIHMFDVTISDTETYFESKGYRPGDRAVVADMEGVKLGLSICYDLRFPHLYQKLAKAGAQILTVPAAFSPISGAAHWEVLLRARAIETGCFVLAPAQCGTHESRNGTSRKTYGHSMVVAPWGEILAQAGDEVGIILVDLDLSAVEEARTRIPAIKSNTFFEGP
ncbi:MAG: carbon-nitrogen hydrolase family protein [Halocynthiibacter sp.]